MTLLPAFTTFTKAFALRVKRWRQPSLLRRLLLAQIAVVALLWCATVGLLLQGAADVPDLVRFDKVFGLVMSATQNLADEPRRQQETLKAFDMALFESASDFRSKEETAHVMQVWQRGRLIYSSTPDVPALHTSASGGVENVRVGERVWRARTVSSPTRDTRVMLAEPDFLRLNFTVDNRSYYLLPLAISLPFLVFPAWLSVLLALRPWRQVTHETATRGPADLRPLSFAPRHKELQPLVSSINGLLRGLRERSARERGLIADAASELRTPLDAMRGNVEALKAQTDDAGQRELMANLLRSNHRAMRLVGQLEQLMRSDEMPQDALPVVLEFGALVRGRIALVDSLARARGITMAFTCEGTVPVRGERESLISMVSNVVENAVKYSPDGGTVTVRVAREQGKPGEPGRAVLRVTDQGPGIPPALRERVFDRFFRNPDQTQSGSGLGLAIVRAVLQKHGGQVALEDGEEGGQEGGENHGEGGRGLRVTVWLALSTG